MYPIKITLTTLMFVWVLTGQERYLVSIEAEDQDQIQYLYELDVHFDHGTRGFHIEAYVTDEQFEIISEAGFTIEKIPDLAVQFSNSLRKETKDSNNPMDAYHDYQELTIFMQQIASDYPNITQLSSIGQSVQGREIWAMKLTDNPDIEEAEPEFKYVANMHGDETPGREFCLYLIEWLTSNYDSLERATDIINNGEIWIVPSMNPDGFELSRRYNANWVDLNRNFPDRQTDSVNTTVGREPETAAVMNWTFEHSFIHSANMHSGALVTNYPYDSYPNITPDNVLIIWMSLSYSYYNPPMWNSTWFNRGITNGADWYVIHGGMQDWNYVWEGDTEVTVEHNDIKWPPASWLPQGWEENRESMLSYLEWIFKGIRGIITDVTTGDPLSAIITVDENPHTVYSDPDVGDYYRIVLPGTYALHVSSPGYYPQTVDSVIVMDSIQTIVDVQLIPECIPGDASIDGIIDISDMLTVIDYINGISDLSEDQLCSSDLNSDLNIDIFDLILLIEKLLENNSVKTS